MSVLMISNLITCGKFSSSQETESHALSLHFSINELKKDNIGSNFKTLIGFFSNSYAFICMCQREKQLENNT
jgi:hypothetical protein